MTSNLANAFNSERLVYTAIEDTEEVKAWFHERFENDPIGRANADSSLLRPQTRARSDEILIEISKDLLGVLICLPPATPELSDSQKPASGDGATPSVPKPTPIGVLHLEDESGGARYRHHHRLSILSISLISEHRGKGYGTEAINWTLDWAFTRANLHAVSLGCLEFNEHGKHVYEKLGFVPEGRFRKCHYHERKWWDVLLYSMLEEEWVELRKKDKA
ncbi:hypothetical protein Daus18300_001777 [Diaporthe australafricana]|uniref:N-acetyltransferase domain-containing protein n=1 Tax=Diaporthe australafricana TaxID=127596 RepID=A0ABR3XTB7_9PEZI